MVLFVFQVPFYILEDFFFWLANEAYREVEQKYAMFADQETILIVLPIVLFFTAIIILVVLFINVSFFGGIGVALVFFEGYDYDIKIWFEQAIIDIEAWFKQAWTDFWLWIDYIQSWDPTVDPNM